MSALSRSGDFKSLDKNLKTQKIIDTAAELFHKKGYRATTLVDVSKELGLTHAALYHYVSSKEELLTEIYIQVLQKLFEITIRISKMDLSPAEKLRLIIREHITGVIIKSLPMIAVFFTEENQLPEKAFRKITKEKNKYTKIIEKIIEEGIAEGSFRKVDPKLETYSILGMCNWVYKWYKPGDNYYGPDQIIDHFIGLIEGGLLNASPGASAADSSKPEPAGRKGKTKTREITLKKIREHSSELANMIEEYLE